MSVESKKNVKSRAYCFTWNNYTKNDIGTLLSYFKLKEVLYVFQEEIGESGTPHLQGVIKFKNPVYITFQTELSKKIHWGRCRSWPKASKYCCKLDSRSGEVYTNVNNLKIIKPPKDYFLNHEPHEWQLNILNIIKDKINLRKIYWFYDEKGGIGKSIFSRHLILKHNALVVSGGSRDIKYAISEWIKEKDLTLLVIDIPRSSYNNISYKAIEEVKNGFFFNAKYESGMVIFNIPHIIIFANKEPKYCQMSLDRFVVKEL